MYQVLLADDEPSVIASLQKSIDWNGLGLELAGCAGSGREALALFCLLYTYPSPRDRG